MSTPTTSARRKARKTLPKKIAAMEKDLAAIDRAAIVAYFKSESIRLEKAGDPRNKMPAAFRAVCLIQAETTRSLAKLVEEGRYLP